jgi:hypothetical protein
MHFFPSSSYAKLQREALAGADNVRGRQTARQQQKQSVVFARQQQKQSIVFVFQFQKKKSVVFAHKYRTVRTPHGNSRSNPSSSHTNTARSAHRTATAEAIHRLRTRPLRS